MSAVVVLSSTTIPKASAFKLLVIKPAMAGIAILLQLISQPMLSESFIDLPPQYPTLLERLQSTFIDLLVIIVLMFGFTAILDHFKDVPDWIPIVLFIGIWGIYEPLCTSLGSTVGNYVKRIRVRQENDITKRINFLQAILRYVVKFLLGWISFLTINSNPQRRAIHDFAANSVVIKV